MKITELKIDGFGIWSGLELRGLSSGLNLLHGPNEAGKTTLMQFVRAMFYGFAPARRSRYLPPLAGGPAGGTLQIETRDGAFQIARHDDQNQHRPLGHLTVTPAEGDRYDDWSADALRYDDSAYGDDLVDSEALQHQQRLDRILGNVDEAVFHNVFALGLRELQELGSLHDAQAGRYLYQLVSGLDRVSLVEVLSELNARRRDVWSVADPSQPAGKSQIANLLTRRQELQQAIGQAAGQTRRYAQLVYERRQLEAEIARWQQRINDLETQLHRHEGAANVQVLWQERAELDRKLLSLGAVPELPEDALERLSKLSSQIKRDRKRYEQYHTKFQTLRDQYDASEANSALRTAESRITALGQQQGYLASLEAKVAQLERDLEAAEQAPAPAAPEPVETGLAAAHRDLDPRQLSGLRSVAKSVGQARNRVADLEREAERAGLAVLEIQEQIALGMQGRHEPDLTTAVKELGQQVTQIRRHKQLAEKIEQLGRQQAELAVENQELLEQQYPPYWQIISIGAVFVVAILTAILCLVFGNWGSTAVFLFIAAASMGTVYFLFVRQSRKLEACHSQADLVSGQLVQSQEEKRKLETQFSDDPAELDQQSTELEAELARLEALLPVEARRKVAQQQATSVETKLETAQTELDQVTQRWQRGLDKVGLPSDTTPGKLRRLQESLSAATRATVDLPRPTTSRTDVLFDELANTQAALDTLTREITDVAALAGISLDSSSARSAQIVQLLDALGQAKSDQERRQSLRKRISGYKRRASQAKRSAQAALRSRRRMFELAGVDSTEAFRTLAGSQSEYASLQRQRQTVQRQIDRASEGYRTDDALERELATFGDDPTARRRHLEESATESRGHLQVLFAELGRMKEQLRVLEVDREVGNRQVELGEIETRLRLATRHWQQLAVTGGVLDALRRDYEQNRQPAALEQASRFLERLTSGRYRRVWTPLDVQELRIEDAQGRGVPVEHLSRGTREQLFLSLRLALVEGYAQQGTKLPLVMDDVLVNFDHDRAKSAAALLRDFADQGHQLLVFTCHDHIVKLFRQMKVSICPLPDHSLHPAPIQLPKRRGTTRRRSTSKPAARPASAPVVPPLPVTPAVPSSPEPVLGAAPPLAQPTANEPIQPTRLPGWLPNLPPVPAPRSVASDRNWQIPSAARSIAPTDAEPVTSEPPPVNSKPAVEPSPKVDSIPLVESASPVTSTGLPVESPTPPPATGRTAGGITTGDDDSFDVVTETYDVSRFDDDRSAARRPVHEMLMDLELPLETRPPELDPNQRVSDRREPAVPTPLSPERETERKQETTSHRGDEDAA